MFQHSPYPTSPPRGAGPDPQAPATAAAAAASRSVVPSTIELSIQRLEDIVEQETTALRERRVVNLKDFNDRKSQALLELTRLLRTLQGASPSPALAARVGQLKSKLMVNQAVLKLHLEAVREVATSLADAIRNSESDGTYTQAISSVSRRA